MKSYKLIFLSLFIFLFSSCDDQLSQDGISYNADETIISINWKGSDLGFTRLSNGKIPGGEVTQMWADSEDYRSSLQIRWSKSDKAGGYNFDELPSIVLEVIDEDGEKQIFRNDHSTSRADLKLYHDEDIVHRVVGDVKMIPYNRIAKDKSNDGGELNFDLQRKQRN